MTPRDLQMEFHKDSGLYAPTVHDETISYQANVNEYIKWLEEQLLTIRNALGINERALGKLKQMEDELRKGY